MNIVLLHLLHIFFIGTLFIYVGISKTNIPNWLYPILLILGLFLIPYQGYKAYIYYKNGKSWYWYNLMHIFLVAPLLIIIGIRQQKTSSYAFDFLLMLGFASIGFHSLSLFNESL